MISLQLQHRKGFEHLIDIHPTTRITISENSLVNSTIYFEKATENFAKLKIGKYCSISTKVSFYLGGNHNTKRISTWLPPTEWDFDKDRDLLTHGDILIGNDVWIGRDVIILSGVKIGNGAVIGAGSVISKDVNPYSIMVGNPAKCVKKRFNDEEIDFLQKTEWWNLDNETIMQNSHIIFGESFNDFKKMFNSLNIS
jgi:virginiamycin A acetyltransferase